LCKFYNGRENIREMIKRFEREGRSGKILSLLKFSKDGRRFKVF